MALACLFRRDIGKESWRPSPRHSHGTSLPASWIDVTKLACRSSTATPTRIEFIVGGQEYPTTVGGTGGDQAALDPRCAWFSPFSLPAWFLIGTTALI
jgi:hypothetical protein